MTERLYSAKEIAKTLGVTRNWIYNRLTRESAGVPQPQFEAHISGRDPMLLWTEDGVKHWHAFFLSADSIPKKQGRHSAYSDHRAVNMVGIIVVTWKLWWRNTYDGGTVWWFSTPEGWYISDNDGRGWEPTGLEVRPADYRYFSVNGSVKAGPATEAVLRSALALREKIEQGKDT